MRLPSFLVLACMRACDEGPPAGDWGEVGLLGLSAVLDRAVFGDLVGGGGGTDLNRLCPGPLLGAGPVLAWEAGLVGPCLSVLEERLDTLLRGVGLWILSLSSSVLIASLNTSCDLWYCQLKLNIDTKHSLSTTVFYYPLEQDQDLICLADYMTILACQSLHMEAT